MEKRQSIQQVMLGKLDRHTLKKKKRTTVCFQIKKQFLNDVQIHASTYLPSAVSGR